MTIDRIKVNDTVYGLQGLEIVDEIEWTQSVNHEINSNINLIEDYVVNVGLNQSTISSLTNKERFQKLSDYTKANLTCSITDAAIGISGNTVSNALPLIITYTKKMK